MIHYDRSLPGNSLPKGYLPATQVARNQKRKCLCECWYLSDRSILLSHNHCYPPFTEYMRSRTWTWNWTTSFFSMELFSYQLQNKEMAQKVHTVWHNPGNTLVNHLVFFHHSLFYSWFSTILKIHMHNA